MFVMLLYYHKLIFTPLSYDTESDYNFFKDKRIHSLCFYGGGEGINNGGGGGVHFDHFAHARDGIILP